MEKKSGNELLKLCFIGTFLLLYGIARSQIYYFDNYSVSDGLAQSKVFAIIQDRNDYLWLGTEGGVSRFNGVNFENFTSEEGLALNGVRSLYEDADGILWMGHTGGGISRFDGKKFHRLNWPDLQIQSDITSKNILKIINNDFCINTICLQWWRR